MEKSVSPKLKEEKTQPGNQNLPDFEAMANDGK